MRPPRIAIAAVVSGLVLGVTRRPTALRGERHQSLRSAVAISCSSTTTARSISTSSALHQGLTGSATGCRRRPRWVLDEPPPVLARAVRPRGRLGAATGQVDRV